MIMKSYEKGIKLEEIITKLFSVKGYDVKHNVKLMGRSGVEHQIDVYAEYKAPLHTSKIIIECKSYDRPIDKEIVMKLIHEVEDLGVDRGILITTSYFTSDAVSTAEGYNIDLWDGSKLQNLLKEIQIEKIEVPANIYHIEPVIPVDRIIKRVKNSLGGIFGVRGKIESSLKVFYPFYEVTFDGIIREVKGLIFKKFEERVIQSTIIISAINGRICAHSKYGRGINWLINLPDLTDDERTLLKILLAYGPLAVSGAASLLGCSTSKARKLLQGLYAKGIVEMRKVERQIIYTPIKIPDPTNLGFISKDFNIKSGLPKDGVILEPNVSIGKVSELIELLWNGRIREYKVIYYPFYACKIVEDGKIYIRAVNMLFNTIDEKVSRALTSNYLILPFNK